jgi:hypothetical protein
VISSTSLEANESVRDGGSFLGFDGARKFGCDQAVIGFEVLNAAVVSVCISAVDGQPDGDVVLKWQAGQKLRALSELA